MFHFGLIVLLAVHLGVVADLLGHRMAKVTRATYSSRQRNASALIAKPDQDGVLSSKTRCCPIQRR